MLSIYWVFLDESKRCEVVPLLLRKTIILLPRNDVVMSDFSAQHNKISVALQHQLPGTNTIEYVRDHGCCDAFSHSGVKIVVCLVGIPDLKWGTYSYYT